MKYDQNPLPPSQKARLRRRRKKMIRRLTLLIVVILGLLAFQFYRLIDKQIQPQGAALVQKEAGEEREGSSNTLVVSKPELPDLQTVVADWVGSHTGAYSVVIMDETGDVVAEHNPDESMFAASIYKLYVAYVGYQKIDDGTHDPNEVYWGEWSRRTCLDEMIRSSHSPCAEKLWAELGKNDLTEIMREYGLQNTSMTGLTTTARDAAIILSRLDQNLELSPASKSAMMDSLLGQMYRNALPAGFAHSKVYNKVGFRELVEYHDVAIVEFPSGKRLVISVLTKNVGVKNIAGLAEAIEQAMGQ